MSERQRANHQYGTDSFLATKWRELIGADVWSAGVMLPTLGMAHQ
jgi:hypothetical protein